MNPLEYTNIINDNKNYEKLFIFTVFYYFLLSVFSYLMIFWNISKKIDELKEFSEINSKLKNRISELEEKVKQKQF